MMARKAITKLGPAALKKFKAAQDKWKSNKPKEGDFYPGGKSAKSATTGKGKNKKKIAQVNAPGREGSKWANPGTKAWVNPKTQLNPGGKHIGRHIVGGGVMAKVILNASEEKKQIENYVERKSGNR